MELPKDKNNNSQTVFISIQRLHIIFNVQHNAEDCSNVQCTSEGNQGLHSLCFLPRANYAIYIYIYITASAIPGWFKVTHNML